MNFGQLQSSAKLPADFADIATSPKFLDCDRIKWRSLPDEDQ
jgi:hypothetical protein